MLKSHIFRQFALLAINFVIFLASQFCFGQVLELGGHWHAVDHNLKLALSNQDTEILNMLYDESVTSVILKGEVYQFSNPVDTFEIGYPYNVIRNNESYTFYFTKLPVVFVEMNLPLSDDYRRPAEFTIVESNGHFLTSDIGINLRGASSQEYLKKSLRIEFWIDSTGEESKNVTLLDLRNDDDWILLPMYNEPLRLRNATAHQLWEDMHEPYYLENKPEAQSGVRGRYIELFLNGEYRGIYFLTERVDRKLLKLQHYSQSEGMQGELYKGKQWGSGTVTFYNVGLYNNNSRWWDGYQKKYPLEEMTTNWQRLYDLKAFTIQAPDSLFVSDIGSKFHLTNAVDYFIFLNLIHSIDNSGKNIFVARHSQADPIFMCPGIWMLFLDKTGRESQHKIFRASSPTDSTTALLNTVI